MESNARKPPGIQQARAADARSKVVGSPDPPLPYRPVRAFPNLKLNVSDRPRSHSGQRSTADHRAGQVVRPGDDLRASRTIRLLTTPSRSSTIPGSGTAYGICFHPKFAENGYLYVGWNGALDGGAEARPYATRYTLDRKTYTLDPESALHVISWESDGHNGGDLEFGLDGMLYVTSGDGTSDSDTNLRGQDLTQLTGQGAADRRRSSGGGQALQRASRQSVRRPGRASCPETWAYGLRNPWRITVDPQDGAHLGRQQRPGSVGAGLFRAQGATTSAGASMKGATFSTPTARWARTPLALPAAEHHHSEARSLTGGVVYHGEKLPELRGAYIYGDHSTGRIWGIKHDGTKVTWHKLLADTTFNITRLRPRQPRRAARRRSSRQRRRGVLLPGARAAGRPPALTFPRKLSESGLFASVKDTRHAAGRDSVFGQFAALVRWRPQGAILRDSASRPRPTSRSIWRKKNGWDFPDETVLVKSFALETTAGDPPARRWIETRFLTKQAGEWVGYSYPWNDEQTDAELVAAEGLDREYEICDRSRPRRKRRTWHYPSRTECMVCHSRAANFVLGLSTAQMNKEHDYGGVSDHQFRVLEQLGSVIKRRTPSPMIRRSSAHAWRIPTTTSAAARGPRPLVPARQLRDLPHAGRRRQRPDGSGAHGLARPS